jgi:hypothetical protein
MFEYKVIIVPGYKMELVEKLNELGRDGWDLINLEVDKTGNYPYNCLLLKREISSKLNW